MTIPDKADHPSDGRPIVLVLEMVGSPLGGIQSVMASVLPRIRPVFRPVVVDGEMNAHFADRLHAGGVETIALYRHRLLPHLMSGSLLRRRLRLVRRMPALTLLGLRLRWWIRRHKPAFVYVNRLPYLRWFSMFLPRRGVWLVYHAHGFNDLSGLPPKSVKLLNGRVGRILAVSEKTRYWLLRGGVDPRKVAIVYNGVETELIRRQAAEDGPPLPPHKPGQIVFAQIGHLQFNKGQHVSIEALASLARNTDAALWLCGDVPIGCDDSYRDELKAQAQRLGVADRVHFLGYRDDVPRVLAAADVAILPSQIAESFGLVLAEAMALGKPCIGTCRGGVPELVESGVTGLIVEPAPAELAEAMRTLAADEPLRQRMGQAGRQRVEQHFGADRQANAVIAELSLLLGSARPATATGQAPLESQG